MKKLTAMLLALVLLGTLCPAGACGENEENPVQAAGEAWTAALEAYDDQLAAVFDSGIAVFSKTEFPIPDPATCEIVMPPDNFWQRFSRPSTEEEFRQMLQESLCIADISPDGTTAVGYVPFEKGNILAVITGDRITVLYPADQRGLGELKNFIDDDYFHMFDGRPGQLNSLDFMGLIWSPDGRYVCPLCRYSMRMKANTVGHMSNAATSSVGQNSLAGADSPYVAGAYAMIDTRTGEIFALEAFEKPADGWFSLWMDACFSGDGKDFYVFCRYGERRTWILQYDTASWERTQRETGMNENLNIMPGMTLLPDGRLAVLSDYTWQLDLWQELAFPDMGSGAAETSLQHVNQELEAYGNFAVGSPVTGEVLAFLYFSLGVNKMMGPFTTGLIRLNANETDQAPDTVWIGSTETWKLVPMTVAEAKEFQDANTMEERDIQKFWEISGRHMYFRDIQLSPGGRFALAVMDSMALLIRLSDMACIPVVGFGVFDDYLSERSQRYSSLLSWSTAGCLVAAGRGGLYRLEAGN